MKTIIALISMMMCATMAMAEIQDPSELDNPAKRLKYDIALNDCKLFAPKDADGTPNKDAMKKCMDERDLKQSPRGDMEENFRLALKDCQKQSLRVNKGKLNKRMVSKCMQDKGFTQADDEIEKEMANGK